MVKIGNNEKCPCGSGKKYIKCCRDKESLSPMEIMDAEFSKYNKTELIKHIASLLTHPDNQINNILIMLALKRALLSKNGSQRISYPLLEEIFEKTLYQDQTLLFQQDLTINMFVEPVFANAQNYRVFPGITIEVVSKLNTLLRALSLTQILPEIQVNAAMLLGLSDLIAHRCHMKLYVKHESYDKSHKILFPKNSDISEILFIPNSSSFPMNRLKDFILVDHNSIEKDSDIIENDCILAQKPIITVEGGHVVIPSEIPYAIYKYLIDSIKKENQYEAVKKEFYDIAFGEIEIDMYKIGFRRSDSPISESTEGNIQEMFFKFDTDKICYLCFIEPNGRKKAPIEKYLQKRNAEIKKAIPNVDILNIIVTGKLEEDFVVYETIEGAIILTKEELSIIAFCEEIDVFDLWYFAKNNNRYEFTPFSTFLNEFAFYMSSSKGEKRKKSFYCSNNSVNMLYLMDDYAANFRQEIKYKYYQKLVMQVDGSKLMASKRYENELRTESITFLSPYRRHKHDFYIASYSKPIWIFSKNNDSDIITSTCDMLIYILETHHYVLKEYIKDPLCIELLELSEEKDNFFEVNKENDRLMLSCFRENIRTAALKNKFEQVIISLISTVFNIDESEIKERFDISGLSKRFEPATDTSFAPLDTYLPYMVREVMSDYVYDSLLPEAQSKNIDLKDTKAIIMFLYENVLNKIKNKIKDFSKEELIKKLVYRNENLLYRRKFLFKIYESENPNLVDRDKYAKLRTEYITATKAVATLIEIIVAEETGSMTPSETDLDYLASLAILLFNYSQFRDFSHFKLFDMSFSELESGRIGFQSNWDDFIEEHYKNILEEEDVKRTLQEDNGKLKDLKFDVDIIDKTYAIETGFSLKELHLFIEYLTQKCFDENKATLFISSGEIINLISKDIYSEKTIKILNRLALPKRDGWENTEEYGYQGNDFLPTNFKRALSLYFKPMILIDENYYVFGMRQLNVALQEIIHKLITGDYPATSKPLSELMGQIRNAYSKDFEKEVEDFLKDKNINCHAGVNIFKKEENLGEIDLLAIKNDVLSVIECKDIRAARNSREISSEVTNLFKGSKNELSYIEKHTRRVAWIKNNLDIVKERLNNSNIKKVESCLVFSSSLPSFKLKDSPVPLFTLTELKTNGIDILFKSTMKAKS